MSPRWCAPLLLFVLASGAVLAQAPTASDLREYAEQSVGRQAFGIYMFGKKVGFGIADLSIQSLEGIPTFQSTFEMQARMSLFGDTTEMHQKSQTWHALSGTGELLREVEISTEDGTTTRHELRRDGEGWSVITRDGPRETRRSVAAPKSTLREGLEVDAWVRSGPAKGAKRRVWSTDIAEKEINSQEDVVYQGEGADGARWHSGRRVLRPDEDEWGGRDHEVPEPTGLPGDERDQRDAHRRRGRAHRPADGHQPR